VTTAASAIGATIGTHWHQGQVGSLTHGDAAVDLGRTGRWLQGQRRRRKGRRWDRCQWRRWRRRLHRIGAAAVVLLQIEQNVVHPINGGRVGILVDRVGRNSGGGGDGSTAANVNVGIKVRILKKNNYF